MRKPLLLISLLALLGGIVVAIVVFWAGLMHGLGAEPRQPSSAENWWSGAGSVVVPPLLTLVGAAGLLWWHHTCHESTCLRYGRYVTSEENGQQFRRCKKHHQERHG